MAELVLGPLLRFVAEREATIWVETDGPCEVAVLGGSSHTFCVQGHHYALVHVPGLEPGTTYEYEVQLDGKPCWPLRDSAWPTPCLRTLSDDQEDVTVVFGSCRVAVPHEPPYTLTKDEDEEHGREIDALFALAHRLRDLPREDWPDLLMMIGDQVYVDEDAPQTRERIRRSRDTSEPPHEEVANFEEYTWLYHEAWGGEVIRWLLSTIPTAMIWDDHDTHDDWNISADWCREMERQPWWHDRIEAAVVSYWVYQHIGNLSPAELERRGLLAKVLEQDDAWQMLRDYARDADANDGGTKWSYTRDIGGVRVVVMDSREGRVLEPERYMDDPREWRWTEEHATGGVDHLLIVDSLPVLMAPAFHHIEAWNEAVCNGAWGKRMARLGEKLRTALDMEHWAAFQNSFRAMAELLRAVASGERGDPPASIVMIGGDVHHAYLADVTVDGAQSRVWQAVCSPFRNPLDARERRVTKLGTTAPAARIARRLARAAGVPDPPITWELTHGPTFDNQFATLAFRSRGAEFKIEKTVPGHWKQPEIDVTLERRLA